MADAKLKARLRELLGRQPRYPISLLPTPLEEVPRFSQAIGKARILIKRDDMTGLAFGGNKARKLDYFIGEAKAQGCDVFIAGGGAVQSNHARSCAAAARKAGMLPVIVVRRDSKYYELQGSYLLTKMLVDGGVYLVGKDTPGGALGVMYRVAEELRAKGYKPYVLPGSGQPAGTLGYVECALELAEQCEARGIEPDWIFITSTGGGQAGLMVGARFLGLNHRVVGIACAPYGTDQRRAEGVADLANRTAELLGVEVRIDPQEVLNLNYGGEGYGIPSPQGLEAFRLLAQAEGVFLDPVYTSKGMAGLIDQVRKGRVKPGETVIFVHTGGLPAIFAYSPELVAALDLSLKADHIV